MGKTGRKNKIYSAEFKIAVIMDMCENHLSYSETVRKYKLGNHRHGGPREIVQKWERIYLEEGAIGLMAERRGRNSKGRPRKKSLDKEVENDLISEVQRLKRENELLQMEIDYIKKLSALVLAEEQEKNKKP